MMIALLQIRRCCKSLTAIRQMNVSQYDLQQTRRSGSPIILRRPGRIPSQSITCVPLFTCRPHNDLEAIIFRIFNVRKRNQSIGLQVLRIHLGTNNSIRHRLTGHLHLIPHRLNNQTRQSRIQNTNRSYSSLIHRHRRKQIGTRSSNRFHSHYQHQTFDPILPPNSNYQTLIRYLHRVTLPRTYGLTDRNRTNTIGRRHNINHQRQTDRSTSTTLTNLTSHRHGQATTSKALSATTTTNVSNLQTPKSIKAGGEFSHRCRT